VPDSDADVVREQFEAVNSRDFARAMSLYDEEVVLVVRSDAFLEAGTFEGRRVVGEYFGNWFATFEPGYRFDIHEARVLDGGRIYLDATHRGRGRISGVDVAGRTGYLYTVRDGKITRAELFATPADALREGESGPSPD
jgi:ketosteroid isomerase-like protein